MLAVFLAATSFAPGAPLRGAVVAPRRAAAPVAALDFDTLHSVTTQIAELVDADGERVYGAVDAPGWVAPVGAVVIAVSGRQADLYAHAYAGVHVYVHV